MENQIIKTESNQKLVPFISVIALINDLTIDCKSIVINDSETLEIAENLAKKSKQISKLIDEKRIEITKPFVNEKKFVDDYAKNLTAELENATKEIRSQILSFKMEMERKRKWEIQRIENERLQKEKEIRQRIENESKNNAITDETINDVRNGINEIKELKIEQIKKEMTKESGIRMVWTFEIVAHELIPLDYMEPNLTEIRKAINAGVRDIAGVKIYQKEQLNLR